MILTIAKNLLFKAFRINPLWALVFGASCFLYGAYVTNENFDDEKLKSIRSQFGLREVKNKETIKIVERSIIKRIAINADKPVVEKVISNVENNDECGVSLSNWRMLDKSRTGKHDPMSVPPRVDDDTIKNTTSYTK